MAKHHGTTTRWLLLVNLTLTLCCGLFVAPVGCSSGGADPGGEGPGHRPQVIALSPDEELELGREAYREILSRAEVVPSDLPAARRVHQ
jgi:hypothetical protein